MATAATHTNNETALAVVAAGYPWLALGVVCAVLVLPSASGCINPIKRVKTPLVAPQLSPDSVVFDVVSVRYPLGDPAINGDLWLEIDEQHLPAEVRERLTANGFRGGIVAGQMPLTLSKLLDFAEKPASSNLANTIPLADLAQPVRNEQRHMPLRTGQRGEVITSGTYDQLPVLLRGQGEVCGQTYQQAQGVLALISTPLPDGRVKLDVTPELHHDQPRQRWVGDQGILRLEAGRPRRVFDDMALSATLKPGDMLILTSLSDRPGSLGHHFFSESGDHPQQKLLIIRLSQTQHNELFEPSQPLKLDD